MAAKGNSFVEVYSNLQRFMSVLTSTACEWVLIFLLLINAVLSYLIAKFADYCNLQRPCILCSRLDHALGNENPDLYQSLFCCNHISDVLSLISCQTHAKLADGRGMCEDCLFSSSTKNKANSEMQRVFGAKLGLDIGGSGFQSSFLNRDFLPGSIITRLCSCCNKPRKPRQNSQGLVQPKSSGSRVPKLNIPLPQLPSPSRLQRRDSLKKIRNKFSGSVTTPRLGKSGFDPLSHVGYTELKINSDSETEVLFSDDDNGRSLNRENSERVEDFVVQCQENMSKLLPGDLNSARLTNFPYSPRPLISDLSLHPDVIKAHDMKSSASHVSVDNHVSELNRQAKRKPIASALPELNPLDEISLSSNVLGIPHRGSIEKNELKFPLPHDFNSSILDELSTLDYSPSLVGAASSEKFGSGTVYLGHEYIDEEACKSVCSDSTRESSGVIAEPIMKETHTVEKEFKPLSFGNSTVQDFNLSSKMTNPREDSWGHEAQIIDISNSSEIYMLRKSASMESLDGSSNISEIEGETIVEQLRRRVEYDRKCMNGLYKELEEERNASAIATSQAMAMITRLQGEKAALHMEALQYLRMMEEQAEYDVEALEKANDLLAEKEKEIQDLEAELEFYRLNCSDETKVENLHEGNIDLKKNNEAGTPFVASIDNISVPCNLITSESEGSGETSVAKNPYVEFEDEKLYVTRCLQNLEKKLCQISCNRAFSSIPNGGHPMKFADDGHEHKESCKKDEPQLNSQIEEHGSLVPDHLHVRNGSTTAQEDAVASADDNCTISEANNHFDSNGQINLVALENEISDLHDRLEALETDHDFLGHMLHSIQSGNEGIQFVREIAHQLQELRKTWIRLRCQSVP